VYEEEHGIEIGKPDTKARKEIKWGCSHI